MVSAAAGVAPSATAVAARAEEAMKERVRMI
jgi:hypothetical protein